MTWREKIIVLFVLVGLLLFQEGAAQAGLPLWRLAERAVVLGDQTQLVGIGVDVPQAKLDVKAQAGLALSASTQDQDGPALKAANTLGAGLQGLSQSGVGTLGQSKDGIGVFGLSSTSIGVQGDSVIGSGVRGLTSTGIGVEGASGTGAGVKGVSEKNVGVIGFGNVGAGLQGISIAGTALELQGFLGDNLISAQDVSAAETQQARFVVSRAQGNVWAKGAFQSAQHGWVERLPGSRQGLEAGVVLAIQADGRVGSSQVAYDSAVVGVYAPEAGFVSGDSEGQDELNVGVGGVMLVKVSAANGPISPGDLLTTAGTPGFAMRCEDRIKCFGALLGKALQPLDAGEGLIKVLLALQ